MTKDIEQIVPRQRFVVFSGRVEANSHTLSRIVHEFFNSMLRMHRLEFGENLCWMGFHASQIGDDERGWVRIDSHLGARVPGEQVYSVLDLPPTDVGSVSIRALSPVASRVLVRINYTPDVLSNLFAGLVQYIMWVVNGEEPADASSIVPSAENINQIVPPDTPPVPLPATPRVQVQIADESSHTLRTKRKKKKNGAKSKGRRSAKSRLNQGAETVAYVPKNEAALAKWHKMWRIIRRTRREYVDEFNEAEGEKPNPTTDDLRDAIARELGFKPSEKTVQRVIRAANAKRLR